MKNIKFEKKLKELELTKKDFVKIIGMPYQTLMNWKSKGETPRWVNSWLENYKYKQFYENIKKEFIKYDNKDKNE
ncbi:hypothetical protein CNZW441b_b0036 (plasmid) [Campylobacter novaezeelandiae]|uniref:Uncharacterized protein n=1 Tax=Campylobacter novaezeelandiae TaxID=2267891 RepID=A0A4Q9JSW6_9BACT|nr:hypothetical protein [Campylobacter novaezeelandiae]QWU80881.1 hypothetical protein CNZW441b_b0036 [Campylobacter novaezeelandiae]TBR79535.1 hypothetical protein DU473_07015 [Campylobacter novaezeelandiae]